jgi:hypothetical protein
MYNVHGRSGLGTSGLVTPSRVQIDRGAKGSATVKRVDMTQVTLGHGEATQGYLKEIE